MKTSRKFDFRKWGIGDMPDIEGWLKKSSC